MWRIARQLPLIGLTLSVGLLMPGCALSQPSPTRSFQVTDDGGWCWFQDERAVVDGNRLLVGSVASGFNNANRRGNVEVHWRDLLSGDSGTDVLHHQLELDDHAAPALVILPGLGSDHEPAPNEILAAYAKHGGDTLIRMRRTDSLSLLPEPLSDLVPTDALPGLGPGSIRVWQMEVPVDAGEGAAAGVTYANLHRVRDDLAGDVLYNFYRGSGWDPNVIRSLDAGKTWSPAGVLMTGPGRPYVKYASDGHRIHFIATEQHPRDADNSLWHGVLDDGELFRTDGTLVGFLGSDTAPAVEDYTQVFQGRPDAVAWPADLALTPRGDPTAVFTVQVDGAGKQRGSGGRDHRFHYARWIGNEWLEHEIGFAGRRLYPGEDDYTGLATIDPNDPRVVYLSTDVHPQTGEPLVTEADGVQHRELFAARTLNGGRTWNFTPITSESTVDNIRPIAVAWGDRTVLLWLAGSMKTYRNYTLAIEGMILDADEFDDSAIQSPGSLSATVE